MLRQRAGNSRRRDMSGMKLIGAEIIQRLNINDQANIIGPLRTCQVGTDGKGAYYGDLARQAAHCLHPAVTLVLCDSGLMFEEHYMANHHITPVFRVKRVPLARTR